MRPGKQLGGPGAVDALNERGAEELRLHRLAPGHDADEAERDRNVDRRHGENRVDHGARDRAAGVAHFPAEITDLVITEEKVEHFGRTFAQPLHELQIEAECAGREIEGPRGVEVQDAAYDHPAGGEQHDAPQPEHQARDVVDAAVEREDEQQAYARGGRLAAEVGQARQKDPQILRQADGSTSDFQGAGEEDLPNEEEGKHAPPGPRAESFAQEDVGAARGGPRRAELGHDHAVRKRDDRADDPGQIGLRPRQGLQNQGDGDERTDPDHVRHVDGHGVQQPQPSLQFGHVVGNASTQRITTGGSLRSLRAKDFVGHAECLGLQ